MSIQHAAITDPNIHEPKGISTASSGQAYVANGSGSGTWTNPLSSVKNLNNFVRDSFLEDVSDVDSDCFFYIPNNCYLTKLSTVLHGAILTGDSTLSLYINGTLQAQTLVIPVAGSALGKVTSLALSPTISLSIGDVLRVKSDGGASTTARLDIILSMDAR